LLYAGSADARPLVQVDVYGEVYFNGTVGAPLSTVTVGQTAHMAFQVDSSVFVDSIPGDVRAYNIIQPSFSLSFSGGASVGMTGGPAYFGVRDGDPVADGFFVSTSTVSYGGVPLTQAPYQADFHASYTGTTLSSLDILAAFGTYDYDGLTVFGYSLWQSFPDNVKMGIDFTHMTIGAVPAPSTALALCPFIFGIRRRRRS
jgi:hypothetical protein